jgi:hypothetical protein
MYSCVLKAFRFVERQPPQSHFRDSQVKIKPLVSERNRIPCKGTFGGGFDSGHYWVDGFAQVHFYPGLKMGFVKRLGLFRWFASWTGF